MVSRDDGSSVLRTVRKQLLMENRQFEFVVEEDLAGDIRPAVEDEEGKILAEREPAPETTERFTGLEPLVVLTVALAAGSLIRIISEVVLDHTRYGLVVDTRVAPVSIQTVPTAERGTIVIIGENESQTFFAEEKQDALALLGDLVGGGVALP